MKGYKGNLIIQETDPQLDLSCHQMNLLSKLTLQLTEMLAKVNLWESPTMQTPSKTIGCSPYFDSKAPRLKTTAM